jgi:hypothetical protein
LIYLSPQDENRFRQKFVPAVANDCWTWNGTFLKTGYGQFARSMASIRQDGGPRTVKASRIAFCLANQIAIDGIPADKVVMHLCDNPACVNPKHLHLGTQAENVADQMSKGRRLRGEQIHQHRLRAKDIPSIRARIRAKEPYSSIAKSLGVHTATIGYIATGRNWAHITQTE